MLSLDEAVHYAQASAMSDQPARSVPSLLVPERRSASADDENIARPARDPLGTPIHEHSTAGTMPPTTSILRLPILDTASKVASLTRVEITLPKLVRAPASATR